MTFQPAVRSGGQVVGKSNEIVLGFSPKPRRNRRLKPVSIGGNPFHELKRLCDNSKISTKDFISSLESRVEGA